MHFKALHQKLLAWFPTHGDKIVYSFVSEALDRIVAAAQALAKQSHPEFASHFSQDLTSFTKNAAADSLNLDGQPLAPLPLQDKFDNPKLRDYILALPPPVLIQLLRQPSPLSFFYTGANALTREQQRIAQHIERYIRTPDDVRSLFHRLPAATLMALHLLAPETVIRQFFGEQGKTLTAEQVSHLSRVRIVMTGPEGAGMYQYKHSNSAEPRKRAMIQLSLSELFALLQWGLFYHTYAVPHSTQAGTWEFSGAIRNTLKTRAKEIKIAIVPYPGDMGQFLNSQFKKEMDEIWQHFSTANLFGPHGPLTESGIELATFHHAVSHAAQSCVSKIDTAIASLTAEWAEHQRRQSVDPDDFLSLHTESPLPETFAHASPTLSPEERARYLTYQNIAVNASQIAASAQAPKDEHTGTGAIYKHDHVRRAFSMFVSNVISDGPEEIATALLQPMFQMTQVTMEGDPAPPADIAPVEAQSSQDLIKAYLRKPDAFALVRKFMTRPAERKDLPFDGPFDQPYFLNNDLTVARLCIPHTPAAPANASPPPLTRPMPMRPIVLQSVLSQPKNVGVGPHLFATGSAAATGGRSAALVASPRPAYFPSPNSSAVPTSFMALANTYFETPVIALPHAKPTTPWQIGIQAICDALEGIERGYQLPFTAHPVGVPTPTYRTHWELSSGIVSLGAAFPSLVLKQPGNSNRLKRAQVSIDNPDGKAAIATLLKDPWTGGPGSGKPQSSVHKLKVKLLEILYRLSGGENKSTKYIIADFLAIYKNFNCKEPDAHLSAEDEGSLHVQFKNYLNTKKYPPLVVDDFCEQLAQKIAQLKAHSRGMLTWGNLYTALIIEKPAHLAPKVYKFGQPNESIVIPSFDPYSSKITNDPLLLELGKRGFSGILGVFVNTLNAEGVRQARDIHLLLSQHLAQKNNVNPAEVPYFTYDALRGEFTAITPKILDALYFNVLLPAEIYLQCYSQVFSAAPKPTAPAPSIPLAVAKKRSPPKASPQLFNDIDLQDMKRVIPFFETLSHETKQEYLALLNRAQARAGGEPLDNQMKKFKKALEQKMPRRHVAVLMHLLKVIEEINLNTYNLDSAPPDFKKEKLDALLALVETLPSVINRSMTQIHLPSGRAFNNSDRIDMFREMLLTVAHLLSPDYIESLKNAYPKKADQVRFMSVLIQVLHETFRIPSKMLALQSTDHFLEFLKKQGTLEIAKIGEDTDDPYRRTAQAILTFIQNESALHAYFSDMMTTAIQTYFSGMPDLQAYFSAITEKMAKEYLVLREALLSRIRLLEINNPTEASLIELIKAATNAKKPPENLTLAENNALNAATAGKRKSAVIDDASSDEGSDKDAMQVVTAVPPIVKFSGENGSPAAQEPKTKKQKTRPASPPIS